MAYACGGDDVWATAGAAGWPRGSMCWARGPASPMDPARTDGQRASMSSSPSSSSSSAETLTEPGQGEEQRQRQTGRARAGVRVRYGAPFPALSGHGSASLAVGTDSDRDPRTVDYSSLLSLTQYSVLTVSSTRGRAPLPRLGQPVECAAVASPLFFTAVLTPSACNPQNHSFFGLGFFLTLTKKNAYPRQATKF
jgi:hypothetical protein